MTTTKTCQAIRVTAKFTPNAYAANLMGLLFAQTPAAGMAIKGGLITLQHSIATDFTDPEYMALVTARIAGIKSALEELGTVVSFTPTACAVPREQAEVLKKPEPEGGEDKNEDAKDDALSAELAEAGYSINEHGTLIVPPAAVKTKALLGEVLAACIGFERIETSDGKVIKTTNVAE